jgi:acyl phosphate:glycerol-3-phosphate acyltransferase
MALQLAGLGDRSADNSSNTHAPMLRTFYAAQSLREYRAAMMIAQPLLLCAAAFACGSIPFGLLVGKAKGINVLQAGSKNIGATNVGRLLGKKWGILVFILDALKGAIPVLIAGSILGTLDAIRTTTSPGSTGPVLPGFEALAGWWWAAIAIFAVLGHMFSPWVNFKGGKGVATGFGALAGLFPIVTIPAVIAIIVWYIVMKLTRYVSVASIVAAGLVPVLTIAFPLIAKATGYCSLIMWQAMLPFVTMTGLLGLMVIVKHKPNIQRLLAGTENKVGAKPPAAPPAAVTAKP